MGKGRRKLEECELDMTPMIDIVFQLIIFFIVTISIADNRNPNILLARAPDAPEYDPATGGATEGNEALTLIIEVDRRGRISVTNIPLTEDRLRVLLHNRRARFHSFPVMIRADYLTPHRYVRNVMDICASMGIGRVSFVAIKDPRTEESRERFRNRSRN